MVWQKVLLLLGEEHSVETIPMCLEADFAFTYESLLLSLKTGPEPTGPRRNRSNSFHVRTVFSLKVSKCQEESGPRGNQRAPETTPLGTWISGSPGAAPKSPCYGLCLSPVQAELLSWHENISKLPEGFGLQAG